MKRFTYSFLVYLLLICSFSTGFSQKLNNLSGSDRKTDLVQKRNGQDFWSDVPAQSMFTTGTRYIFPKKFRGLQLDLLRMKTYLTHAPMEFSMPYHSSPFVIALPMPDGSWQHFRVLESPMMEKPLADMFPEIRTYTGQGMEDPSAILKMDVTPHGFHAMILTGLSSTIFIDPFAMGDTQNYISYYRQDFIATAKQFECHFDGESSNNQRTGPSITHTPLAYGDCNLRQYRLALSATGEYTAFHGGTVALAQAAQVTTMNRVNGVYERDFAVRMNIIGNNNLIVYTNAATDPFTNGNPGTMINQNQTNTNTVIGSGNYDIGHVFGTNSGGLAGLGVVCNNSQKARGVTGSAAPIGDPFDIDYVAHEMGHQFGGNHSFNNSCGGNRNNATAMEPGSASTIMGYAGICAPNVQSNSDDFFHNVNMNEMSAFMTSGGGNSCASTTALSNNAPSISSLGGNQTIPASTPFVLTATATDPDPGNGLTYCWEQNNNQITTQPPQATATGGPNFRSNDPIASPSRYFPNLPDLTAGISPTWEVLSSVTRTFSFSCIVRDNAAGGGCTANGNITISVDGGSGPFVVTYPSNTGIVWTAGTSQTVTWNVANTSGAPVSCANVDIFLSTDGGLTYPITLATNVPNNGSRAITVPNNPTTTARVMVKGSGRVFFDISDNNFEITAASIPVDAGITAIINPPNSAICDNPFIPEVTLRNYGTNTLTSVDFKYQVNAGPLSSYSWTGSLVSGNTVNVTLPAITSPVVGAPIDFRVYTTNPNATADLNNYNDTMVVTTQIDVSQAIPYAEPFDAGSMPGDITVYDPNLDNFKWVYTTSASGYGTGTGSAMMDNFNPDTRNTLDWLIIPNLDFSSSVNTKIKFDVAYAKYSATYSDTLIVAINSNCGTLYTPIYQNGGSTLATAPDHTSAFIPTSGEWRTDSIDLTAYDGMPVIKIAFINVGGWGNNMFIDNINVSGSQNCTISTSVTSSTNVSCNGGNNGSATASASNPGGPVTYLWSNGQTTATATGLAAGTYTVTATDSLGCSDTSLVVITQPTAVNVSATSVNTACGGSTGTATASPTGGTPGYTYLWSNAQTTATATGLAAGSYTVTVTDNAGCTGTTTVTVSSNAGPTASISGTTNSACGGNTGTASATGSGGTPGYTYLWSNGQTTATATNLAAGTYTVTVTDQYGCTGTTTATVSANPGPSATISTVTDASCGSSNGSATVSPTGGTPGYTYLWSNGQTTVTATGLAAGSYTVTVTDLYGCTAITTANVSNINGPSVSMTNINHTSCGNNNGSATASPTGGTGAYSYNWSNSSTSQTVSGLAPGTYTVTVTDSLGCTGIQSVTINSSSNPVVTIQSSTDESCGQGNGSATAAATGGSGGYNYNWSSGGTGATETGLSAGTYSVTVTDGSGCTDVTTVTIGNIGGPTISLDSTTDILCFGDATGTATVSAAGGTPGYTYSWSNGGSNATETGLAAGTYTVTVTDNNGCTDVVTVTINQPAAGISATSTPTDETSPGASDGSISTSVSGGTSPYSYQWSNGQTTSTATGLGAGVYTCTITDANGCQFVVTDSVGTMIGFGELPEGVSINIFPNPSSGEFFLDYNLDIEDDLNISIYNKIGQLVTEKKVERASSGRLYFNEGLVSAGVYSVEIRSSTFVVVRKLMVEK